MSTFINVTVGGDDLRDRQKQQQEAQRRKKLESDTQKKLTAEKAKQNAQSTERQGKGLELRKVNNDLSAYRSLSGLGILFTASFVDAPPTIWSDGTVSPPGEQRSAYQTSLDLTESGESPAGAEQENITLPTVLGAFWGAFDARSPITGQVLDRRYIVFTGIEDGFPVITYGYAGAKFKLTGSGTATSITAPLQPRFKQVYSDAGSFARFPFHCYASIKSASVRNIETGGKIEISNDIMFAVGDRFRLAPTPFGINSISILNNIVPYISRDYIVASIASTNSATTFYELENPVSNGGAFFIDLSAYRSYPDWDSVPQSDVVWTPGSGAPVSSSPDVVADETDYIGSTETSQGSKGALNTFLYVERRTLALNETTTSRQSGIVTKQANSEAFDQAAENMYGLAIGSYRLSSNTDTEIDQIPLGPFVDGGDIVPASDYQAQNGPWSVRYTVTDYATEEFIVFVEQGTYPDETLYPITFTFAQLAPLLTSTYGTYYFPGTLENRFSDPPGTYQDLRVSVVQ